MARPTVFLLLVLWVFRQFSPTQAFNILGICPSASYSHQQPFQALMKALASRGHNVTVVSTIPSKKPIKNYEDVDLSFTYRKKDCTGLRHMGAFTLLHKNMREASEMCEEQLFSGPIADLISRNKTFDAVIIEQLWYQCYYALVNHYHSPVLIGFLSVGNLPYAMDSVGNPDDPLLNPDMAYPFTNEMSLNERIWNVVYTTWTRLYYKYWHLPRAQKIVNKWTTDVSVRDIDRNFSLVILGNNHVFGYPKPLLPNVIEVHSLQITGKRETLPKDIEEFLDNAGHGAIYFSLGSNLQTRQLPVGPLTALCNALGSLKQRVLWKHDGDMAIQPANVKFVKWAPQQAVLGDTVETNGKKKHINDRSSLIRGSDEQRRFIPKKIIRDTPAKFSREILTNNSALFAVTALTRCKRKQQPTFVRIDGQAHPKVMAYVMQGGLQSLQEAVHYSVPVVAIPFFGDQLFNARKILDAGIGLTLNIDTITEESIRRTLTDVIENKTYYNNIKLMSEIVKDELVKPMDRAVWNVEHVIKFPKSKHFQYHGHDINVIDYYGTIACLVAPLILLFWYCYRVLNNFKETVRGRVGVYVKDRFAFLVKPKMG